VTADPAHSSASTPRRDPGSIDDHDASALTNDVLDDYDWLLRGRLRDSQLQDAWMAAYGFGGNKDAAGAAASSGINDVMTRDAWKSLIDKYRLDSGCFDDARIRIDAEARMALAKTAYEIATVVQSAEDLDAVALVFLETDDVLYDAEALRERVIRRERAVQRIRSQQQLAWYVETYGEKNGKQMFDAAREARLKTVKIRLTLGEARKQVQAAEHAYSRVASEFVGYIITAITVVMFMIHPNITKQFFMVFSCKSIGGIADPGASFLLGDLTEPCHSSQHLFFMFTLGIPMLLLWVLGIPLFAWVILFSNRKLIQANSAGLSSVTLARKKALESQMAFLYRGYKPTRFYWFLMEMGRKVALVAIAVFFPGALYTQLLLASLLIFACILAQLAFQPFENRIPGTVEFLSLGTSFMVFFLANFLFIDTITDGVKVAATVLIAALVMFFFAVVVVAFVVLLRDEASLGPLRVQLRDAHVRGLDVKPIIRNWRIERARISANGDVIGNARPLSNSDASKVHTSTRGTTDDKLVLDAVPAGFVQDGFDAVKTALHNNNEGNAAAMADEDVQAAFGSSALGGQLQAVFGPTLAATDIELNDN
jgi:hypothetical protein